MASYDSQKWALTACAIGMVLNTSTYSSVNQGTTESDSRLCPISDSTQLSRLETIDVDESIARYFADRIFERHPGIQRVAYWREKEEVTIWTILPELDRSVRHQIYGLQGELMDQFPEYKFDFYVLSSSVRLPQSFRLIEKE